MNEDPEPPKSRLTKLFQKVDNWIGPSRLSYKPACYDLKEMIVECVLESDCMKNNLGDFRFCLTEGINKECKAIRHDWYICRKSQVDWNKHHFKDDPR